MTDQTEHVLTEEQKAELARKAKLLVPSFVEQDTSATPGADEIILDQMEELPIGVEQDTSATPTVDEILLDQMEELPVKSDLMWLHPIELIKGLFSSRKD